VTDVLARPTPDHSQLTNQTRVLDSAKHVINRGLQPLAHKITQEPCAPSRPRLLANLRANALVPRSEAVPGRPTERAEASFART
jgi:hypothetical protein